MSEVMNENEVGQMVSKRDVLALIERMPEQIDAEELIERIYLLKKLETGK
jgi:hypothetical protein